MDEPAELVVVTGMSGAGRSTAVAALEDLGFFCVDNLPTPVLKSTIDSLRAAGVKRIGLGIDVRGRGFLSGAEQAIAAVGGSPDWKFEIVFLDASDEALLRRFSSTRRPHPLSTTEEPGSVRDAHAVLDGIQRERALLAGLRDRATVVVDTTRLSVHELRKSIVSSFGPAGGKHSRLRSRIMSFGFKFGSPVDADLVFDVRFLKNPHFVAELQALPGTHPEVRRYVFEAEDAVTYLKLLEELLAFSIPRFEKEGRSYLTVAIGFTGGRHRSVAMAERLGAILRERLGLSIEVVHRDLDRVNMSGPEGDPDHGSSRSQGVKDP
ncbi:MAG TPA: RNase adapter RapZ [Polyangiaceae bacterium]